MVGAGVAGLAAIGTAVSLGAIVNAFVVRPEVAEQIGSMGADFVFLEFEPAQDGAAGQPQGGKTLYRSTGNPASVRARSRASAARRTTGVQEPGQSLMPLLPFRR